MMPIFPVSRGTGPASASAVVNIHTKAENDVRANGPSAREAIKLRRCRSMGKDKIVLACTECKQRNYNTTKNKKNNPDRLEMNKFCRFCKKHTLHRETK